MLDFLMQACEDTVTNQLNVYSKSILVIYGLSDALQGTQVQVSRSTNFDMPSNLPPPLHSQRLVKNRALKCQGVRLIMNPNQTKFSHRVGCAQETRQPFVQQKAEIQASCMLENDLRVMRNF